MKRVLSEYKKLNLFDFAKGLIVAVISAVITAIYPLISTGVFTFNWKEIATVALTAGIAYLSKNLFTNSGGGIGRGAIYVIKNTTTGEFLTNYTENPLIPVWGIERNALEFSKEDAELLAGRIGPGVIGVPKKP